MLTNLASRASLVPLGIAAAGALALFAALPAEPAARAPSVQARHPRIGRCGAHRQSPQARIERRLVEHAIEVRTPRLEACVGHKPFDLVVRRQLEAGGHSLGVIVSGTGSAATSRCLLETLEAVEYPPITRAITVETRLRLVRGELVVEATAR